MIIEIIRKDSGEIYKKLVTARVATRNCPTSPDETEIVVYSGGHGYAFNTRFYDIVINS